jgi:cbb3-type cytochrome oxidase subunit 1
MGLNFIRIAVIYLVIGTSLGIAMGISQRFTLIPVHAHVLLLGWATLAIAGVVYQLYPMAANTRLARIHFWLHNLGLPVFMVALALMLSGHESLMPLVAIAALVVLLGLFLFAANFLLTTRTAA